MEKVVIQLEANTTQAIKGIDKVDESIQDLNTSLQDTGKGFEGVDDGAKKASKGIKGIGNALKTAGIGLAIAAFATLKEIFEQNQKVADTFKTAFEFVSIAFNDFANFVINNTSTITGFFKSIFDDPVQSVTNLGTLIKENITERFNSLLDTLGYVGDAVAKFFKGDFAGAAESAKQAGAEFVDVLTGVDDSANKIGQSVSNIVTKTSEYVKETGKAAQANVELEKTARLAEAANQGLIEKYDRQAEQLRQTRDDESKSFEERIKANEELGKLLDEQEKSMMANANARVKQAEAELAKNKDNVDLQIAYQEALNEQAGIEAQITGFRSEQQTNTNSLLREQKDLQNELALIGKSEREIERLELQQDYHAKKLLIEREITDEAQKNEMLVALKKDFDDKINGLNEDAANNEITWAKMTQDQKLAYAQQGLAGLAANLGKETAAGKAAAVASALISTYQGAQDSYASLAKIPVVGPALGFAAAAAAVGAGLANVKAITSTKTPNTAGLGGGSTPSVSVSRPTAPTSVPPAFNIVGAGAGNQLAETIAGQSQQPIKAFVTSQDVTTAQSLERNIVEGASI